jgi:hypothetical protein
MSSYTQADYDAISAAIAEGVTEVRMGDRTVRYRSLNEMMRVKQMMARELGLVRRPNRTFATFRKGLAK